MPSRRVAAELNAGTYYLTLTIQRWYYLFDRYNRWQILADSICYCQENKGLELNGYVFMLNHVHLIATSSDIAGFLRDFKRFTSTKFKSNLETTEPSRLLKNVMSAAKTRQKLAKKRSLLGVNEHFEPLFNAVFASAIVFQQAASVLKLLVNVQGSYRFWMATNAPKKIENPAFYRQKLNYIHENLVRKGYVAKPEYWFWSSANPASPISTKFY